MEMSEKVRDAGHVAEQIVEATVRRLRKDPARLPWIVWLLDPETRMAPVIEKLLDVPVPLRHAALGALRDTYGTEVAILHFNDGDIFTSASEQLLARADLVWSRDEDAGDGVPRRTVLACLDGPGEHRREWCIEFDDEGVAKDAVEREVTGTGNLRAPSTRSPGAGEVLPVPSPRKQEGTADPRSYPTILTVGQNTRTGRFYPMIWEFSVEATQSVSEDGVSNVIGFDREEVHEEGFDTYEDAVRAVKEEVIPRLERNCILLAGDAESATQEDWDPDGEAETVTIFIPAGVDLTKVTLVPVAV